MHENDIKKSLWLKKNGQNSTKNLRFNVDEQGSFNEVTG